MKITWLGQAGLLLQTKNTTIMVDPYFSDSVGKRNPQKHRRVDAPSWAWDLRPDILLITHDHADHMDMETLPHFLRQDAEKPITVLSSYNTYMAVKELGGPHNYVLLNRHSVWTEGGVTVYAVKAEHSDLTAVGFIVDDGERTYYIAGDTLYNYDVIDDVLALCADGPDVAFVPVNGVGNNMNMADAEDFCADVNAKITVPLHCGLFDDIPLADFKGKGAVIPTVWQEIPIDK